MGLWIIGTHPEQWPQYSIAPPVPQCVWTTTSRCIQLYIYHVHMANYLLARRERWIGAPKISEIQITVKIISIVVMTSRLVHLAILKPAKSALESCRYWISNFIRKRRDCRHSRPRHMTNGDRRQIIGNNREMIKLLILLKIPLIDNKNREELQNRGKVYYPLSSSSNYRFSIWLSPTRLQGTYTATYLSLLHQWPSDHPTSMR